jgi:hypothetical protein
VHYRPVPTGDAQKKSSHDIGISWLHLQFAERLPSAPRGGKLRAQTSSVNSEMPHRIKQPNQFVLRVRMHRGSARTKIFLKPTGLFLPVGTRALLFFSQENFFAAIENKVDFFLVDSATDFYSQARWRGQPQSACE